MRRTGRESTPELLQLKRNSFAESPVDDQGDVLFEVRGVDGDVLASIFESDVVSRKGKVESEVVDGGGDLGELRLALGVGLEGRSGSACAEQTRQ
jgi:hypothetical protein